MAERRLFMFLTVRVLNSPWWRLRHKWDATKHSVKRVYIDQGHTVGAATMVMLNQSTYSYVSMIEPKWC